MQDSKEYIIRKEGTYGRYGIGEVICDGVFLFRVGMYNLTKEELERKVLAMQKPKKSGEQNK